MDEIEEEEEKSNIENRQQRGRKVFRGVTEKKEEAQNAPILKRR